MVLSARMNKVFIINADQPHVILQDFISPKKNKKNQKNKRTPTVLPLSHKQLRNEIFSFVT